MMVNGLDVEKRSTEITAFSELDARIKVATIWVIDDDAMFCEMCSFVLGEEGQIVVKFGSSEAFMSAWIEVAKKPDLLVLDYALDDYNGLDIKQWLDEQEVEIPIIFVSGLSAHAMNLDELLASGKVYYLQKPFSASELTDMVYVVLAENLFG
ncbi:MAG: response regulator [Spartobacteria bacterium]|nr:response regulator [Spartobacteria bacterium]